MKKTIQRRHSEHLVTSFSNAFHPLLQKIYATRQVVNDEQIDTNLSAILKPDSLKGLSKAVSLISSVMRESGRILVVGDFDADGATSSAVAVLALRSLGAKSVDFLVPNRFEFGYGLTPEIVAVACQRSPDLIITVDNGISSIDGVNAAQDAGIKVLITDHHLPGVTLPAANAIVNPNQPGCRFESKNLAGVGVIFYVMSALRTYLRQHDWFEQRGIKEPNMAELLDLVALGTVADVVPLDKNNRILVEQGLRRIRAGRSRPGIRALLTVAKRNANRIVSSDLGFSIGPRLNAVGRLDDMSLGIQCLITNDESLAFEMAVQMDDLNHDRKAIEVGMQQEALVSLGQLSIEKEKLPKSLCLFNDDWHQGVIGILASRIKDRYHRPVIAFASDGQVGEESEEIIKGSARSIPGLHIRDTLDAIAAKHPDILSKFGGHAMAAGMSLRKKDYSRFVDAFEDQVGSLLHEDDLRPVVLSDGELLQSELTLDMAHHLRNAGPWGQQFPEPLFDGVFQLLQQRIVGGKHLKMVLAADKSQAIDAIAFNIDTQQWPNNNIDQVRIAYKLDANEFRGRESVQLLVDYIESVD